MKGGYQIISFASFTGADGEKVKDAYKKASTGKAILVEDINIGDSSDILVSGFGVAVPDGNDNVVVNITIGTAGLVITIAPDDVVTLTPIQYTTQTQKNKIKGAEK